MFTDVDILASNATDTWVWGGGLLENFDVELDVFEPLLELIFLVVAVDFSGVGSVESDVSDFHSEDIWFEY